MAYTRMDALIGSLFIFSIEFRDVDYGPADRATSYFLSIVAGSDPQGVKASIEGFQHGLGTYIRSRCHWPRDVRC